MADHSTLYGTDEIVDGVLDESDSTLFCVNPPEPLLRRLFLADHDNDVSVVASTAAAKDAFDDFIAASKAAESVRDGDLQVRTVDGLSHTPAFATHDFLAPVVTTSRETVVVMTTGDAVGTVVEASEETFEGAEESSFRTPPRDIVMETLAKEVDEGLRNDFATVIDAFDLLDPSRSGIDEVETILVLAARREILLYEVSKWGEDIGLASKATFSRAKSRLEDRGLVETVKVPIDVGRPRLRLLLSEDIAGDDPVDAVSEAASRFNR